MNPVFAADFMTHDHKDVKKKSLIFKNPLLWLFIGLGVLFDFSGYANDTASYRFIGNLLLFFAGLMILNKYVFTDAINVFQNKLLPSMMNSYEKLLHWTTQGWRPVKMLIGTFILLIFSFVFLG